MAQRHRYLGFNTITALTGSLSFVQGDENKQNVRAWGVQATSDQNGSCMSVCVWERMGMRPSTVLCIWPSWSSSILHFIFSFLSRKRKNSNHWTPLFTNTVPKLAPCCLSHPGLWPPEQCQPCEKAGQVGWGGWTWEGWRVTQVSLPNPSMTSHPPLANIWPVSHGLFTARWDGFRRGGGHGVSPVAPHPFKWFSQSV